MIIPNIWKNNPNVPNHQPDMISLGSKPMQNLRSVVHWSSSTAGINLSSASGEKGLVINHIEIIEIEKNQQLKKWFDYF